MDKFFASLLGFFLIIICAFSSWAWSDINAARKEAEDTYKNNNPHIIKECTVASVANRRTVDTLECGELHVHKNVGRSLEIGVTYSVETYSGIGINWKEIDAK